MVVADCAGLVVLLVGVGRARNTRPVTSSTSAETRAVLHRYEHDLYNARNLDLVEDLLANPMYRHDAGGAVTEMSHDD